MKPGIKPGFYLYNINAAMYEQIIKELKKLSDKDVATNSQRFFKTGSGEYGEGSVFRGIRVPALRKLVKQYRDINFQDTSKLLKSKFHEDRLLSLFIFVDKYKKADDILRQKIHTHYLKNTKYINNWDLVDTSAVHIIGDFLKDKSKAPLHKLAKSKVLWERRIAIMATFNFIRAGEFDETLKLAKILLKDEEDLIHKAVGWMLREIGNRKLKVEEEFLKKYYQSMPRTMLRYAIEKFPEPKRKKYLQGKI